jgi:hypothetical protein
MTSTILAVKKRRHFIHLVLHVFLPNPYHLAGFLRASLAAPPKRLPKRDRRGFWTWGPNWCTTSKPKILSAPVGSQINSRRSHASPCAARPYREHRHRATRWKKAPGPLDSQNEPQILPSPSLPPFRAATTNDDAPLSSSPPPAEKSSLSCWRFPVAVWLGFRRLHRGYRRRTHRRRPTTPARCLAVCLAGRYGQWQRAYDGGAARGWSWSHRPTIVLEYGVRVPLATLIRCKHIYNFWCSMLVYTNCFIFYLHFVAFLCIF